MMGRITEAMIALRKRVDLVDVLILENNNIPHLPSRAFGSVAVNRLFIEHNGIARYHSSVESLKGPSLGPYTNKK